MATNPVLEARQEIGRLGGGSCSQEDFAKLTGLSPSMISRYERGTHPLSPRALLKVQRLLALFRSRNATKSSA